MATGFHPEQIGHSITAMFIHCKQYIAANLWDSDVQKSVQEVIVEIARHNAGYSKKLCILFRIFNGLNGLSFSPYFLCPTNRILCVSLWRSRSLWNLPSDQRILQWDSNFRLYYGLSIIPSGMMNEELNFWIKEICQCIIIRIKVKKEYLRISLHKPV